MQHLTSRSWLRRVVALVVPLALCASMTRGADPADALDGHFQGVVVLRDGGVLTGAIVSDGQQYRVATASREVSVAAGKIEVIAATVEEAYERRRSALRNPSADTHIRLADWCLRQNLLDQASAELALARSMEPTHPKLVLLERRVAVAKSPRERIASTAREESPQGAAKRAPARKEVANLRLLTSELPEGAVERFTRKIQPVVVNSCTNAGCHQVGGEQSFQLDRSLLHGMASRRSTTRNLHAVLSLIDRSRPEESPLLTVPRRPHGGMDEPVFGPYDAKLVQQLTDWVELVTGKEEQNAVPAPGAAQASEVAMSPAPAPEQAELAELPPADLLEPDPFDFEGTGTLRPPGRVRYGARLVPVEPRDEFDPEIFNRQFASPRE